MVLNLIKDIKPQFFRQYFRASNQNCTKGINSEYSHNSMDISGFCVQDFHELSVKMCAAQLTGIKN